MLPYIILHNSISLDGSLLNFDVNMELHYQIAGKYKPDAHLIGSNTIKTGIELYSEGIVKEENKDFKKPKRDKNLPYWIIIDTKGALKGLLHTCRRFEICKDVTVLTSEKTPKEYVNYLKERDYDYCSIGKNHIDIKKSFEFLNQRYNIKTILTDTGKIFGNLLLTQGFVNEVSLLIHPVIVGEKAYNIFCNINENINLEFSKIKTFNSDYIWIVYKIKH